ncbi:unnamed protein product [Blepharisma stoltei]|uniref:FYVE-type domain-containing protein n=1 Tax=Blepharisma stoltei TaxID=1481888 RepID=A0AAU9J819_9CILI|nr:unnamed protein product [Blepharisma stoltei]
MLLYFNMGCCGSNSASLSTDINEREIEEVVKTLGLYKIASSNLIDKLTTIQKDAKNLQPLLSEVLDHFKLPNKLSYTNSSETVFYKSLLSSFPKLKIAFALLGKDPTKNDKAKLIFGILKNSSGTLTREELVFLYKSVGEIAAEEMILAKFGKEDAKSVKIAAMKLSYAAEALSEINADGILGTATSIDSKSFIEEVSKRHTELVSTSDMRKKLIPASKEIGLPENKKESTIGTQIQIGNLSTADNSKIDQINKANQESINSGKLGPKEEKPIINLVSNSQQAKQTQISKEVSTNSVAEISNNPNEANPLPTNTHIQSQKPQEESKNATELATEVSQATEAEYKCSLGHILKPEKSESPHLCEVCSYEFSLPHYRCDVCNTFICQSCADFLIIPEDSVPLACKESHALKKVNAYDFYNSVSADEPINILCIVCEGWIDAENGACYHCRRCGMEVCNSCYSNFEDENSPSKTCNSCSKRRIWTPVFQGKKFQCDSCNLKRKYMGYFYCDGCNSKICLKSH